MSEGTRVPGRGEARPRGWAGAGCWRWASAEPRVGRRRRAGVELISHGVLPGKAELDQLDGACSVRPAARVSPLGPSFSGTFYSRARRRSVGYTIAYPPGHGPGSALPLVVMLHGFGGNHTDALAGMSPAQAVALHVDGRRSRRWRW